jgi:hypothetical protein
MIRASISVIPAEAGIQANPKKLDSCFHRNDKPLFHLLGECM